MAFQLNLDQTNEKATNIVFVEATKLQELKTNFFKVSNFNDNQIRLYCASGNLMCKVLNVLICQVSLLRELSICSFIGRCKAIHLNKSKKAFTLLLT